jgi:MYXO-CTERM domain-containing protein
MRFAPGSRSALRSGLDPRSAGLRAAAALVGAALALLALLTPRAAGAFCGFYVGGADAKLFNNATMVVMMREGTRTVLSMQNNYQGPPSKFAMVVPVPVVLQKENVKTLKREAFDKIDQLAAPRLVEYWEQDPCFMERMEADMAPGAARAAAPQAMAAAEAKGFGVKIEAQFTVGEYEIVILSAKDSTGLDAWLRAEKYNIPAGAEPYLRPYVAAGSKFFVAKVDPEKVTFKDGMATLSPLRFHYDSDTFSLPIRLGLINSGGTQDLIVHILAAQQRYEVANYKNVTIPTNFDVGENARAEFGAFYASLFDRTIEKNPGAVVTEYSWDATTCDPCPGPALDQGDFTTFGADALPQSKQVSASVSPLDWTASNRDPGSRGLLTSLQSGSTKLAACVKGTPGAYYSAAIKVDLAFDPSGKLTQVTDSSASPVAPEVSRCVVEAIKSINPSLGGTASRHSFQIQLSAYQQMPMFTVTRLHARYTKEALGEDLVFKTASPITGGREVRVGSGELEHGATTASVNNFQGRYAIRHAWTGPITCKNPRRGLWGGPPYGTPMAGGGGGVKAAKDTAFAPRGKVQLASFVRGGVPELQVTGTAPAPPGVSASPQGPSTPGTPSRPPVDVGPNPGCKACTIGGPAESAAGLFGLGLVALALVRRRR